MDLNQVRRILYLLFHCKTAFLEAMDSVGLDTCILANQESIQADLDAVVDEYFNSRRSKSNPIELNFNRTQSNSIELNRWIEFD